MSGNVTSNGLVIRLMFTRLLGARVHVFDGDRELVLGAEPVRILHGEASPAVRQAALRWVERHQHEILFKWRQLGARSAA